MGITYWFPTLQHLSLVQVAAIVMNRLHPRLRGSVIHELNIKEYVNKELENVSMPNRLKLELSEILREMFDHTQCMRYREPINYYLYENYEEMVWVNLRYTYLGELDLQRMHREALMRVSETCQSNISYFKLACELCLEDMAVKLFHLLSPEEKASICKENSYWHTLVCDCAGNSDKEALCMVEVQRNWRRRLNPYCLLYYWNQLSAENKQAMACKFFVYSVQAGLTSLLLFILPYLREEELTVVMNHQGVQMALSFLHFPFASYFIPIFRDYGKYIPIKDFPLIMFKLLSRRNSSEHSKFKPIIYDFWCMCTPEQKMKIAQSPNKGYILLCLYSNGDMDSYQMVLQDFCQLNGVDGDSLQEIAIRCTC